MDQVAAGAIGQFGVMNPALDLVADLNWPGAALAYGVYRGARGAYNYVQDRRHYGEPAWRHGGAGGTWEQVQDRRRSRTPRRIENPGTPAIRGRAITRGPTGPPLSPRTTRSGQNYFPRPIQMSGRPYVPYMGPAHGRKRYQPFQGGLPKRRFQPERYVPRGVRSYGTKMNQEREIVALHDLRTYDLASNADQFGVLKIADILNAPGLGRYTKRFDRIRFLKLKIDFFATNYTVTAISTVSQNEATELTDKDQIIRQANCRFHNLQRSDGINCSRTFDVSKVAVLGDHVKCADINTVLAGNTLDCGIHFCFLHADTYTTAGGYQPGTQKVQCKLTFVVEFLGYQQAFDEMTAET